MFTWKETVLIQLIEKVYVDFLISFWIDPGTLTKWCCLFFVFELRSLGQECPSWAVAGKIARFLEA